MNKNEIRNFIKQYKNTVCLDESLRPIKLLDCLEDSSSFSCLIISENGTQSEVVFSDKFIALKGRLKERDYNYVEALFHRNIKNNA